MREFSIIQLDTETVLPKHKDHYLSARNIFTEGQYHIPTNKDKTLSGRLILYAILRFSNYTFTKHITY